MAANSSSSFGGPPLKRQRVDEEPLEIVRAEIWKSDGNIVLQAQDVQFRIHRSTLEEHSIVFRDMFSLPNPPPETAGEATIEGCPVIILSDTSADWLHVLKALYERGYFPGCKRFKVDMFSAILQLGRKYQMDELRQEVITILKSAFLRDWRNLLEEQSRFRRFDVYPGIVIDLANLAEEEELTFILPALLLFLTVNRDDSFKNAVEGLQRSDGSTSILSASLLRKLVSGRDAIAIAYRSQRLRWLCSDLRLPGTLAQPPACQGQRACGVQRQMTLARLFMNAIQPSALVQKAFDKDPEAVVSACLNSICPTCRSEGINILHSGRLTMLDNLPIYFGLPPWPALRGDSAAAS